MMTILEGPGFFFIWNFSMLDMTHEPFTKITII